MKRFTTIVGLCLAFTLALAACSPSSTTPATTPADSESGLAFITGSEQGTYYRFGGVLASKISETTSTSLYTVPSDGSQENIEALQEGKAQIGFTQSDVLSYAYEGTRLFDKKADKISVIAELYKEQVQIVTMNPNLKSVSDLKGKNVSIGASGSGVYFNAVDVLEAYGMTEKDINPSYQSFADSVEALQNGKLDAAFVVAGTPTSAISGLAATTNIYLISLDEEHINKLTASSSHYSKATISKKTYNTPTDTTTVAVGAVLVARDDVPEEDVYNVISGIYDNLAAITKSHSKGAELDISSAGSVTLVPYHKGAAKYFAEQGITVPTK